MTSLEHSLTELELALSGELSRDSDAGLAAREQRLERERAVLLRRLAELSPQVLRLAGDVDRHRRRLNDLVYDSVSMELGGSD